MSDLALTVSELEAGQPKNTGIVIKLDVADRAALEALAEALGEIAAGLWHDGKIDLP